MCGACLSKNNFENMRQVHMAGCKYRKKNLKKSG